MANPPAVETYLQEFRKWLLDASFVLSTKAGETWDGNIHIEWEDQESGACLSAEHQVSIELSAAFPYNPPIVRSLDDPPLARSWHLSPRGTLCLWREPGGWVPFTTAQKLLKRIYQWHVNYHTGIWSDDFTPTDLNLYVKNVGALVVGDLWLPPPDEKNGEFILWQPKENSIIPCLVSLKSPSDSRASPEGRLVRQLSWNENTAIRYRGFWFRLPKAFVPSNRLESLLKQIDDSSENPLGTALSYVISQLSRTWRASGIPFALGYHNHNGQEIWLFLWAEKPTIGTFHLTDRTMRESIEIGSFVTMPAGKSDLLRRTVHLSHSLEHQKVAIIGVGALGGSVALLLAKSGLGDIRLVDSDIIRPTNVIRHVVGLKYVGFPKTMAVSSSILQHNPDSVVSCHDETWEEDQLKKIIEDVDLIIDTTADSRFSLWLNQIVVKIRRSALYAATYRRATIGRLIIYRPEIRYRDPCLACYQLSDRLWSLDEFPRIPPDPSSNFEEEGCTAVTEEADALHIELTANLTAMIATNLLLGKAQEGNLLLQVSESVPHEKGILAAPGLHEIYNESYASCPICNRGSAG